MGKATTQDTLIRQAAKINEAEAKVFVTKQFKFREGESNAEASEEVIGVHRFITEPAKINVELGLTLNLGNYESARIGVAVSVPCYKEEIDSAYDFANSWAKQRIEKEKEVIQSMTHAGVL